MGNYAPRALALALRGPGTPDIAVALRVEALVAEALGGRLLLLWVGAGEDGAWRGALRRAIEGPLDGV